MHAMNKLHPANYEEFLAEFHLDIPPRYNFAFDFLDAVAREDPGRLAMVHVGPDGTRAEYDLAFFSRESSRLANALQELGIGKGDAVMLLLFRRVEFWTTALALHKIGAVPVPSTSLLTPKDIEYRVNRAQIRGVVADASLAGNVDAARGACPTLSMLSRPETAPSRQVGRLTTTSVPTPPKAIPNPRTTQAERIRWSYSSPRAPPGRPRWRSLPTSTPWATRPRGCTGMTWSPATCT